MNEINLVEEVQKAFMPFIETMERQVEIYLRLSNDMDSSHLKTYYECKARGIQEMIFKLNEELHLS